MKAIYVDIDGTLTDLPEERWGAPRMDAINRVKELIAVELVIIWSAGGWSYAKAFCNKYGLKPYAILPKPDIIIDDKLTIRAEGKIEYILPESIVGAKI